MPGGYIWIIINNSCHDFQKADGTMPAALDLRNSSPAADCISRSDIIPLWDASRDKSFC